MPAARITVLSDDASSRRHLRAVLAIQNYLVFAGASHDDLPAGSHSPPDLYVLDVRGDAAAISESCYSLRANSDAGIIVLARGASEADKIAALDAGADDFLSHPCSDAELLARIRVLLRRRPAPDPDSTCLDFDDLRIDLSARRVFANARESHLTPKETDLLACLLRNPNATVPHSRLLRTVWGQPRRDQGSCLRVVVNQLRRKIERDPGHPRYLITERWVGYRFEIPEGVAEEANRQ